MRTLRFIVEDQILKRDPACDFDNLVPGTDGYLRAEFQFSPEWNGSTKVAAFYSVMGREYPPQVLRDGRSCMIPAEACAKQTFYARVIGKKDGYKILTNKVAISQMGGK